MSLQTIVKLLKWLVKKLNTEQTKLAVQSTNMTLQIVKLKAAQGLVEKDAAIAKKMSAAIKDLTEV